MDRHLRPSRLLSDFCGASSHPAGQDGLVKTVRPCGSTRYKSELVEAQATETLQGRIGDSTAGEIEYGESVGKAMRIWNPSGLG